MYGFGDFQPPGYEKRGFSDVPATAMLGTG
jgi:hypothetical protein